MTLYIHISLSCVFVCAYFVSLVRANSYLNLGQGAKFTRHQRHPGTRPGMPGCGGTGPGRPLSFRARCPAACAASRSPSPCPRMKCSRSTAALPCSGTPPSTAISPGRSCLPSPLAPSTPSPPASSMPPATSAPPSPPAASPSTPARPPRPWAAPV